MMQCVQSTLDRRLDLWPGAAEVWRFVGPRRTTRYQAQHSVDEFWVRLEPWPALRYVLVIS